MTCASESGSSRIHLQAACRPLKRPPNTIKDEGRENRLCMLAATAGDQKHLPGMTHPRHRQRTRGSQFPPSKKNSSSAGTAGRRPWPGRRYDFFAVPCRTDGRPDRHVHRQRRYSGKPPHCRWHHDSHGWSCRTGRWIPATLPAKQCGDAPLPPPKALRQAAGDRCRPGTGISPHRC